MQSIGGGLRPEDYLEADKEGKDLAEKVLAEIRKCVHVGADVCQHHLMQREENARALDAIDNERMCSEHYARMRENDARMRDPHAPENQSKVPSYYNRGGIVCWEAIEAWGLNYNTATALKYLMRAGHKTPDPRQDLKKAIHCLEHELECLDKRDA